MTALFLDTNILVYAYSHDSKSVIARSIMNQHFVIGVQTLNEFANASLKLGMDWPRRHAVILGIASIAKAIVPTTIDDFQKGLDLAERHRLSIYDALMLAIALHAGCTTIYTEDMHCGLVIENSLTIVNPFA